MLSIAYPSDSHPHPLSSSISQQQAEMVLASPTSTGDHHSHQSHNNHPSHHHTLHHPSASISGISTSSSASVAATASAYYPFYDSSHPYAHAHSQHSHVHSHSGSHQAPPSGPSHPLSSPLGSPASAADPSFVSMSALSPNDNSRRMSLYDMPPPMLGTNSQPNSALQATIPSSLNSASGQPNSAGGAIALTPTSPTRRKGRSNRSVSGMTPDQLERKRANDREAQRRIRQRIKEQMEGSAKEIDVLKNEIERLTSMHQSLESENQQLRNTLDQYRHGGDLSLQRLAIVSPTAASGMMSPTHHNPHSDVSSAVAVATAAAAGHHSHLGMRHPPPLNSPHVVTGPGSWASGPVHPDTPGPASAGMAPYLGPNYHPYPFDPSQMGSPQSDHSQNQTGHPSHSHSHSHSNPHQQPMMSPTSPYGPYRAQQANSPPNQGDPRHMNDQDMHPGRGSVPQTPISGSHGLPPPSSMAHHQYMKNDYVKAE